MNNLFTKVDIFQFNLKDNEKRLILKAIEYSKGNLSLTKDLLGIPKSTLYVLLKRYKINIQDINKIRDYYGYGYKGFKKNEINFINSAF